jgi:hypothetical protein
MGREDTNSKFKNENSNLFQRNRFPMVVLGFKFAFLIFVTDLAELSIQIRSIIIQ